MLQKQWRSRGGGGRRRWTWRHRQFWIPVQFNGKPNFNLKLHYGHMNKECKIIWEFQIRWGRRISQLKTLRRYLRCFRGTHWRSSLSRRLLAFYTWMNRVTDCLYAAQCRSRGIGEWLKRLFFGHRRPYPPSSGGAGADGATAPWQKLYPLSPPNETTLCTEVYGEPPFWVQVSPTPCSPQGPPLPSPHFEKSGYTPLYRKESWQVWCKKLFLELPP